MKIESLLSERCIVLNLELSLKSEVIDKMISLVADHPGVVDIGKLGEDVLRREQDMSTGIGKSLALPHAKSAGVNQPVLAFATLQKVIDFDSIDHEPVKIVFLLATPEEMLAEHLKLLGRITKLAGREDVRRRLVLAQSPGEVIALFRDEEKDFPQI
ncbi:MAG: PTS sugar transporter subunit IIA [Chlorobium sp.]|nr:MAG: PTS sugar transporter subunit IIA [Chlorobium sp.]